MGVAKLATLEEKGRSPRWIARWGQESGRELVGTAGEARQRHLTQLLLGMPSSSTKLCSFVSAEETPTTSRTL